MAWMAGWTGYGVQRNRERTYGVWRNDAASESWRHDTTELIPGIVEFIDIKAWRELTTRWSGKMAPLKIEVLSELGDAGVLQSWTLTFTFTFRRTVCVSGSRNRPR
jgi:hypothetical protein